jgi:hypothetical protein
VLLKDIDSVNATHSRQHGIVTAGQDATTSSTKEKPEGKVSLSALLKLSMALLRRKDGTECMLRHLACKVCRQLLELCLSSASNFLNFALFETLLLKILKKS